MDLQVFNDNICDNSLPSVVDYKLFVDNRNIWGYDLNKYKGQLNSPFSLLLIHKDTNCVEGVFKIEKSAAPSGTFLSSNCDNYIDLEGTVQLELISVEIPTQWISKPVLKKIFIELQLAINVYLKSKTVILWFKYSGNFYMCPMRHEPDNNNFDRFSSYMSELLCHIIIGYNKNA